MEDTITTGPGHQWGPMCQDSLCYGTIMLSHTCKKCGAMVWQHVSDGTCPGEEPEDVLVDWTGDDAAFTPCEATETELE